MAVAWWLEVVRRNSVWVQDLDVYFMSIHSNSHPTESISQFIDHHLQPLVTKLPSYIKDTTHFLNKLNNNSQLPNGVLLVTLDVTLLCTNTPHKDGIQACSDFLEKRTNPAIKTTRLCDLIWLISTNNTFTFNGQQYRVRQINGTAMGTKMAPSYANFFMGKFERSPSRCSTLSPDLVVLHRWYISPLDTRRR